MVACPGAWHVSVRTEALDVRRTNAACEGQEVRAIQEVGARQTAHAPSQACTVWYPSASKSVCPQGATAFYAVR